MLLRVTYQDRNSFNHFIIIALFFFPTIPFYSLQKIIIVINVQGEILLKIKITQKKKSNRERNNRKEMFPPERCYQSWPLLGSLPFVMPMLFVFFLNS